MTTKITYILSNIDKAVAFEWISDKIDKQKFELSFILLSSKEPYLFQYLKKEGVECYYISFQGKKLYFRVLFKIIKLLRKLKPNIVHTHLFDANILGLLSAKFLGVKKRIYTRHHSTFHHESFPNAVKWDLLANKLATHIIAISKNVEDVLIQKEKVNKEKVHLVHHGFELKSFENPDNQKVYKLKQKYHLLENEPIIGVISRYIELKGIQYVIPAFKSLLNDYPNAKLVLANASGNYKKEIKQLLENNLELDQYVEITFEQDLFSLYHLFDVYVHVPINPNIEAFGQTYVEALTAGIPSVFTLSGVAKEFIVNEENALVVPYKDAESIYQSILRILNKKELSETLIKNGKTSVSQFNINYFIEKLENLYNA